jgi:hypothetical protein
VLIDSAVGELPGGADDPGANVTLSVRGGLPAAPWMLTVRCSTRSAALRASVSGETGVEPPADGRCGGGGTAPSTAAASTAGAVDAMIDGVRAF